jgi:replicative DNA helicase
MKMSQEEWHILEQRIGDLAESPLYIDDTPSLSIFEFRAKARRLALSHKIKVIFIDYLQLMTGPPSTHGFREQEVSAISRSLKAIAKELNIPIIALSQLNRMVETRGGSNKRPQLSDLRESGAIEQDADLVLFIHRPEYYGFTVDENDHSTEGLAEIIIAKHRNGATADVALRFCKDQAKFEEGNFPDEQDSFLSPHPKTVPSKMNNGYKKNEGHKKEDYSKIEASKEFAIPGSAPL